MPRVGLLDSSPAPGDPVGRHPRAICSLAVAHFDHRLREDSARDAEHVAAYARARGLEVVLGSEDVPRRARSQRLSIEEAARDARYEFLAAAAQRLGASCVATAHTRSDQIETVLMRILRGSGRFGAAGIPERRDVFVRPLLEATRADTRDYCLARNVPFIDDPSNGDARFYRNRVRLEILPALRSAFPSIDEALLRIADAARDERDAFAIRTAGWLDQNLREEEPGAWTLRLAGFDDVDDEDAAALLREALVAIGCARDVGRAHYRRLLDLARDDHAGSSADLPGVSARREHDAVILRPRGSCRPAARRGLVVRAFALDSSPARAPAGRHPRVEPPAAALRIPGAARVGDWIIKAEVVEAEEARRELAQASRDATVAYFDAGSISSYLTARPVRSGDAMRPFGMDGRKKLSDLFIDRKIPRRVRECAIVIEGDAIYWVPGLATSERGRIGETTRRALRLEARLARRRA
jgi:tRNA(Ile)-lysidine synthase